MSRPIHRNITVFKTEEPVEDLKELAHIMLNLRHYTKLWNQYYGHQSRERKEYWEKRADNWIEQHTKKQNDEQQESKGTEKEISPANVHG